MLNDRNEQGKYICLENEDDTLVLTCDSTTDDGSDPIILWTTDRSDFVSTQQSITVTGSDLQLQNTIYTCTAVSSCGILSDSITIGSKLAYIYSYPSTNSII